MKKWFAGVGIAVIGATCVGVFIALVVSFVNMVNTTGQEFVEHFVIFIIMFSFVIFYPRFIYDIVIDNKWMEDKPKNDE